MESKLLYHITDYRNLPSILEAGCLSAHSQVASNRISYSDIAHSNIQDRRATTSVDVPPFGKLHDYVPFYFAPRSPMLYAIKNGSVEGFNGRQSDIIYLVTNTKKIEQAGKEFVFTDGHAIMAFTDFYKDLNDLDEIDWDVMESTYWNDTDEYPDRKRKRQAEFLVHESIELDCFLGIGVMNERMKNKVNDILYSHDTNMKVLKRPKFYY